MKTNNLSEAITRSINTRVELCNDENSLFRSEYLRVLPASGVTSKMMLYPNYSILVMKEFDLRILSIGKSIDRLSHILTLDFYDERVEFFQHINHIGYITFVNFTDVDIIAGDFGPAVTNYAQELNRMFGLLTNGDNYEMYKKMCPINERYKFLSIKDAEPLLTNGRIIAMMMDDESIKVFKVKTYKRKMF